jgi:hypothetical protein
MSLFVLKALLMAVLPFYRVDFPVDRFPKEFSYAEYDNGREMEAHLLKDDDPTYIALKNLITEEQKGWKYDLNTYAHSHMFSSPTMQINCLGHSFIVNYDEDEGSNEWIQISKNVKGTCPTPKL